MQTIVEKISYEVWLDIELWWNPTELLIHNPSHYHDDRDFFWSSAWYGEIRLDKKSILDLIHSLESLYRLL